MSLTHCPACGGKVPHPPPAVCTYCGAALHPPASPPAAGARPPALALKERLDALARHPRFSDLLRREPGAGAQYFQWGATAAVGVVFATIALFMFSTARSVTHFPAGATDSFGSIFGLVCLFFVAVGVLVVASSMKKTAAFAAAPLERLQALVADKRTEVSGGGDGSAATTRYFVTIETGDGRRLEVGAAGKVAGKAVAGDVGIAYVKGGVLLDFERVQV
jgi:hypothetical protein